METNNSDTNNNDFRECGVCRVARPGAVDWGCTCEMTDEERNEEAREFARMHD